MTPAGALTTLYKFCDRLPCGIYPDGGLLQATSGVFYGTTYGGGARDFGTFFSLNLGFAPFVKTVPVAAKTGASVIILGDNLTGATAVTFNGAAAAFTIVSATEITASVPPGATTGPVAVALPGGKLASLSAFRVLP